MLFSSLQSPWSPIVLPPCFPMSYTLRHRACCPQEEKWTGRLSCPEPMATRDLTVRGSSEGPIGGGRGGALQGGAG